MIGGTVKTVKTKCITPGNEKGRSLSGRLLNNHSKGLRNRSTAQYFSSEEERY